MRLHPTEVAIQNPRDRCQEWFARVSPFIFRRTAKRRRHVILRNEHKSPAISYGNQINGLIRPESQGNRVFSLRDRDHLGELEVGKVRIDFH